MAKLQPCAGERVVLGMPKNVTDLVANKKTQTSVRTLQAQVLNFFIARPASVSIKNDNANMQSKEGTMQCKVYALSLCFDERHSDTDKLENDRIGERRLMRKSFSCISKVSDTGFCDINRWTSCDAQRSNVKN